jgi:hypothetical protein
MAKELSFKINADSRDAQKQFDALRKSIQETEESIGDLTKEFGDNSKEVKTAKKQLEDLTKAYDELNNSATDVNATFEDVYGDLQPLSTRLGELEDRLYELALAGKQNTQEFRDIQNQAVELRQTVIRVDESIDDLAGNRGLSTFGTQLGSIGQSLMSLDFERASKQASGLASNAANIDFGTAIKSIKNLGSTFASLGKALLANPIFLIAAAVIGIGMAIKELLDEIGLLKVIMEAIGAVFEWVGGIIEDYIIQPLKDLTDWLGWTNNAAEELAETQADAAKKAADAQELASKRTIQALDNEMREIQAKGELNDADFERVLAIEAEKRKQLAETAKARAEEAVAAFKAAELKGELDEKELADMKAKAWEMIDAAKQAREEVRLGDIEDDAKRRDRREKQAEEEKADIKERADRYKEYLKNRLDAERQIEDLKAGLIKEDTERELEENRLKYERLREDTLANEKLTQEEKTKLLDLFRQTEEAKAAEIRLKEEEKKKAKEEKDAEEEKKKREKQAEEDKKAKEEALAREKEFADKQLEIKKAQAEAEAQIQEMRRSVQDGFLAAAQNLVGENEALANTLFLIEKGLAIGRIIVDTAAAIQANRAGVAAAGPPLLGPGIPNPAFIAAVANATAQNNLLRLGAAASIASIAGSTIARFMKGGGSVPSSGGGGGGGAAAGGGAPAPAALNQSTLFATGGNPEELVTAGGPAPATPMVKAVVVESDITNTQNTINSIQETAKL